jgi:hypothetical protein
MNNKLLVFQVLYDVCLFFSIHLVALKLIKTLEEESKILINWFSINKMKANLEKFQAIAVGKKNT